MMTTTETLLLLKKHGLICKNNLAYLTVGLTVEVLSEYMLMTNISESAMHMAQIMARHKNFTLPVDVMFINKIPLINDQVMKSSFL